MKGEKSTCAKDILLDTCDSISSFSDPAVELSLCFTDEAQKVVWLQLKPNFCWCQKPHALSLNYLPPICTEVWGNYWGLTPVGSDPWFLYGSLTQIL